MGDEFAEFLAEELWNIGDPLESRASEKLTAAISERTGLSIQTLNRLVANDDVEKTEAVSSTTQCSTIPYEEWLKGEGAE